MAPRQDWLWHLAFLEKAKTLGLQGSRGFRLAKTETGCFDFEGLCDEPSILASLLDLIRGRIDLALSESLSFRIPTRITIRPSLSSLPS